MNRKPPGLLAIACAVQRKCAGAAAVAAGWVYDALSLGDLLVSLRTMASAAPLAIGGVLLAGAGYGITRAAPSITDDMRIKQYSRLPGELAFAMALGAAIYLAVRCIV